MDSEDFFVSAALLGRSPDATALVADLAARFERSLPGHVQVDRKGWGKAKKIMSLTVNLEPDRFRVQIDQRGPEPWIDQIVRGVCVKSEQVNMDRWLERLATSLNREALKSTETRLAIEDALR